jgi:phospholipid transport system substrate-binding protein
MKSRYRLTLAAALLGVAASVCAQPPGYGYGPGGYGPPGMVPPPAESPMGPRGEPTPFGAGPQSGVPTMPEWTRSNPMAQAAETIKEGLDKLIGFLSQKEMPNRLQTAAFLDKEIAPYFDFDYMANWVAGPAAARMSEADKKALSARLEASFLSAMGNHLANYSGQQVRVLRPRWRAAGAVTVPVAILRSGAYPARLDFRMYKSEKGWKVYDVVAGGRSAASYYRVRMERMGLQGLAEEPPANLPPRGPIGAPGAVRPGAVPPGVPGAPPAPAIR